MTSEEALGHLVESSVERKVIDRLKDRTPIVLSGSRGLGKSILMRAAEAELLESLNVNKILPVYVIFRKTALIATSRPDGFLAWMVAKLRTEIARAATMAGVLAPENSIIRAIRDQRGDGTSTMEEVQAYLEDSYRRPESNRDDFVTPDPEELIRLVEDLCVDAGLARVNLLIDEAIHAFRPDQQRQFFTLMRDLRSPRITVKAATYPGITSFGDSFDINHDAELLQLDRNITDGSYLDSMRNIAIAHDSALTRSIEGNHAAFNTLAYAATGNPRILLKTVIDNRKLARQKVRDSLRIQYGETIWVEHSDLVDKYAGYSALIDWGRAFLEQVVIPRIAQRNTGSKEAVSRIWVHKDAPAPVHRALQLLCYSGILRLERRNVKGSKGIGSRYLVNLGCHIVLDDDPIEYCMKLVDNLTTRVIEYPSDAPEFGGLRDQSLNDIEPVGNAALQKRLRSPASVLDVTDFFRKKFGELELYTIGDVLEADEAIFVRARQVGKIRARQMKNAAANAVLEYLSG